MKFIVLVSLLFCQQTTESKQPVKQAPEGLWMGSLTIGPQTLRLVTEFKSDHAGSFRGSLDSIDQSAYGIPITFVSAKGDELTWEIKNLGIKFVGKKEGPNKYVGQYTQSTLSLPFVLERIEKRPVAIRPQDPKPPFPYTEEDVGYDNRESKTPVHLAGTLTLPKTAGPHPAVLLITGSGSQNRNEELFNHRPFLVLADHLTRKGIAVLRVDDRGIGYSTGSTPSDTSADFATDVLAGVRYLKTRKEIDPKRIGLIGHSEGGMIAPMVAAKAPQDIAFLVLMAGTGVTGEEILYLQAEKLMKAGGAGEEIVKSNRKVQDKLFEIVRKQSDPKLAEAEIIAAYKEMIPTLPEALKAQFPNDASIKMQSNIINNAWMRYFLTYDPRPALTKVTCPVLAINGQKDLQVIPEQNLPEIEKALKAGGNTKSKVVVLPSLNHLFQTCNSGHLAEYGAIQETIAPVALQTMSDWICQQTGLAK